MTIRSAPFMTVSASHGAINATVVCRAGRVVITISRDGIPAVENIDVGFTLDGEIIGPGSTITSIDRRRRSDRYRKYTGKVVGDLNYEHDEVVLIMTSPNAVEWELIVRASSDGAAFRYRVPASPITQWIGPDATRIPLPVHGRTWLLDYQTWYETKRFSPLMTMFSCSTASLISTGAVLALMCALIPPSYRRSRWSPPMTQSTRSSVIQAPGGWRSWARSAMSCDPTSWTNSLPLWTHRKWSSPDRAEQHGRGGLASILAPTSTTRSALPITRQPRVGSTCWSIAAGTRPGFRSW
jgi:hypothetical protein